MKKISVNIEEIINAMKQFTSIVGAEHSGKLTEITSRLEKIKEFEPATQVKQTVIESIDSINDAFIELKEQTVIPSNFQELSVVFNPLIQEMEEALISATELEAISAEYVKRFFAEIENVLNPKKNDYSFENIRRLLSLNLIGLKSKLRVK